MMKKNIKNGENFKIINFIAKNHCAICKQNEWRTCWCKNYSFLVFRIEILGCLISDDFEWGQMSISLNLWGSAESSCQKYQQAFFVLVWKGHRQTHKESAYLLVKYTG